ncbi:MAG: hypothetical protein IPL37_09565 [Austwickia sp.]|nr:hypothetical protein [Austwickia sp.]
MATSAAMKQEAILIEFAFHGGMLTWRQLRRHSRSALQALLSDGVVVRDTRGHYALAQLDSAERVARSHNGARIGLTAALAHGWGVARRPDSPQFAVPKGARRPPGAIRRRLTDEERRTAVTSPLRTVLDCARTLPFAEALAVADSALQSGSVGFEELTLAAGRLRGRGAASARRVAAAADARAAGPFESAARAICLDEGLSVTPQFLIADDTFRARVDLADEANRIVIECDSFAWHGSRPALQRDARRYNALVVRDWIVLRVVWEDVFIDTELTRQTLRDAVRSRGQTEPPDRLAGRRVPPAGMAGRRVPPAGMAGGTTGAVPGQASRGKPARVSSDRRTPVSAA